MRASETKIDKSGNRYRKFGTASREEQIRRLKRVKTIRNQMICGEFKGVRIVCTKDRDDTVLWLIQQFELIRKSFDPAHPPWRVKSEFDDYVKVCFMVLVLVILYPPQGVIIAGTNER